MILTIILLEKVKVTLEEVKVVLEEVKAKEGGGAVEGGISWNI
jgi:hypothetical protein